MSLADAIRAALTEHQIVAGDNDDDLALAVRTALADRARLSSLETELTKLRPLADEGRAYRSDLVTSALAEGKRAQGDAFSEETYRGLLEGASLEAIKRFAADWRTVGDKLFPPGRATSDGEPEPLPTSLSGRRRSIPASARS